METLYGCLYFLQSHDFMCEMYIFSTFVTTSPDFRAESCLLTFPLPSIFPCVTSRCAFLPASLFASYNERPGQIRIVPFSKALHFPTILTGTLLWHAWQKKKKLVVSTVGYAFSADEHTVCLPSNQIFILTYVHWYNKFYVFDLGHRWQYKRYTQSTNINTALITYCSWVLQGTDA
jgi:hypothetical protein